jgi:hypothetical protein
MRHTVSTHHKHMRPSIALQQSCPASRTIIVHVNQLGFTEEYLADTMLGFQRTSDPLLLKGQSIPVAGWAEGSRLVVGLVVDTSSWDLDAPPADGDSITVVVGGRKDYRLDDTREDYATVEGHFEKVVVSFACGGYFEWRSDCLARLSGGMSLTTRRCTAP